MKEIFVHRWGLGVRSAQVRFNTARVFSSGQRENAHALEGSRRCQQACSHGWAQERGSSGAGGLTNSLVGSSEAVAPPRGAAPCAGSRRAELQLPDYFERQQVGYARCGLHALNNALGAQLISAEDMSTACTEYLAEMQFEGKPINNQQRSSNQAASKQQEV